MIDLEEGGRTYLSKSFTGLNLSGKILSFNEFDGCTFIECDFTETRFSKCTFLDCSFINCNLSVARLEYSKFSDVGFDHCKLIGIDWTDANWPNIALSASIRFSHSILNDCSFFGLSLEQIVIEHSKARDVDFREGDFSKANFSETDLANSLFSHTNLGEADFTGAINYSIDIHTNSIKGATFSRYEALSLLDSLEIELVD